MSPVALRLAVPDLVSNSYFPAVAAVRLGTFEHVGIKASLELISPITDCIAALRDGGIDLFASSAHAPLMAFPQWSGSKLLCAQSQGTYWFLVMRKDLGVSRGDLARLAGRRIAAVPFVGEALKELLRAAALDPDEHGIDVTMPESARAPGTNFGVAAVEALRSGEVDGLFANGVGAEIAIREGIGDLVLDVRRGDGPAGCFDYTMPAIAARESLLAETPEIAARVVDAIVLAQNALRRDVGLAARVGAELFPAREASLIADVVERDLPYYDASLSEHSIAAVKRFSRSVGLLDGDPSYSAIVATELQDHWRGPA